MENDGGNLTGHDDEICQLLDIAEKIERKKKELPEEFESWNKNIDQLISALQDIYDRLMEHLFNSNIVSLSGTSAFVLGSIGAIVGLALSGITFGASLSLTYAGTAMAATGGALNLGSRVTKNALSKSLCKNAVDELDISVDSTGAFERKIDRYNKYLKEFQMALRQLPSSYGRAIRIILEEKFGNRDLPEDIEDNLLPFVLNTKSECFDTKKFDVKVIVPKNIFKLVKYIKSEPVMLKIFQGIFPGTNSGGGSAISLGNIGIEDITKPLTDTVKNILSALNEVGKLLNVGLIVLNVLFLIWGFAEMITISIEFYNDSETEQSKELFNVIRKLKSSRNRVKKCAKNMFDCDLDN